VADRPDISRAITHRVEDSLVPVIRGFIAADPDRILRDAAPDGPPLTGAS